HPPTAADYGIRSISIPGAAYVYVQLVEGTDIRKQFSDVNLKLNELNDQLPQGAGPISFQSDFGDTAAIMLTVASPRADQVEIDLRARDIESAIRTAREHRKYDKGDVPVDIIYSFPRSISPTILTDTTEMLELEAQDQGVARRPQVISGTGFIVMDGIAGKDDVNINRFTEAFVAEHFQRSDLPPDVWPPIMVHDPAEVRAKLTDVAGDKYTYADLDNFSDLIARTVEGAPETSKVERRGLLPQAVYLEYSQYRLAQYGLQPADLSKILGARNIIAPGGNFETGNRQVIINASVLVQNRTLIGDVAVTKPSNGAPVYLRDLVNIIPAYQSPAKYLNYYTWRDSTGQWRRSRAVTLAIYMRDQELIANFGVSVDK